jgi:AcrR family transcriptional regulator
MHIHHLYAQGAVDTYAVTSGRIVGSVAALIALAGAVISGLALARRRRPWQATVALLAGVTGMLLGGFVVATADGGPGTGNGIVGGYAALAIGLIATLLAGLSLIRSRRIA